MSKKMDWKQFLINYGIICVLGVLVIITGIFRPKFFSVPNFRSIALNVAPRFIIAVGVSGCLITKGTDLSAGRMVGLAACISGTLLQKADYSGRFELTKNLPTFGVWWVVVVLLIAMLVCAIFGLINGLELELS